MPYTTTEKCESAKRDLFALMSATSKGDRCRSDVSSPFLNMAHILGIIHRKTEDDIKPALSTAWDLDKTKKAKANEYCTRKTFYIKESNLFGRQVTFSNFSFINETDSGEEQRKGIRVSKLRRYFPNGQGWGISLLSLSVSSEARDTGPNSSP